jgi:hypothetical protein
MQKICLIQIFLVILWCGDKKRIKMFSQMLNLKMNVAIATNVLQISEGKDFKTKILT